MSGAENADVRRFGGFVVVASHSGVPVASDGGSREQLHAGCRSPDKHLKHHSAAAPKEYVCRDKILLAVGNLPAIQDRSQCLAGMFYCTSCPGPIFLQIP